MKIRVSCTALACITDDEGRLVLFVARTPDKTIMRPLGGSLESGAEGREFLIRHCGAEQFEDSRSLRFVIPSQKLGAVERWFAGRRLRETGVLRVINQRLIDNLHVITANDARHLTQHVRGRTRLRAQSPRHAVAVRDTVYLIEIFDVGVPKGTMTKLKAAVRGTEGPLYFATPDEVREQSAPGGYVSSLAPPLLLGAS